MREDFARISTAPTREQAMEIALMAASGYVGVWKDDVTFRQLPYPEGFDICGALIRAALDWKPALVRAN